MDNLLDLTNLDTKRYFIVGELHGDHYALQRMLYQQRFTWADTLVTTGDFFDLDGPMYIDLFQFLRNTMNCYSVKGEHEIKFLEDLEDPEKSEELNKKLGKQLNEVLISYIRDLPLIIKINDYYIIHAGLDPTKTLDDQEQDIFYSIGKYDKDSRFYRDKEEDKSWYELPFLINGTHVNICFGHVHTDKVKVPAGYNLGRNPETDPRFRCLVIDKTQWMADIITWQ